MSTPRPSNQPTPLVGAVPPERWADTCTRFSQRHRGWLVQVWALPTAMADSGGADPVEHVQELATGVPLHGVALEDVGAAPAVIIHVCDEHGSEAGQPLVRIEAPRALALEHDAAGEVQGLRIDDAGGHTTRLHFRITAPPEALDGLAETER